MITLIHPSRSRPKQARETAMKWIQWSGLGDDQIEYILSLDNDDPELWSYKTKGFTITNVTIFRSDNRSAIDAINIPAKFFSAYRNEPGNFLIVISDDFDCPQDWGIKLLQVLKQKPNQSDWILKTPDGIQEWVITLPIMDWVYYKRFGYVYHPDYRHCFCDTEMTAVGDLTGRLLSTFKIEFYHRPHGQIKDNVSERADATFEIGKKLFIERKARHFDLKPEDILGQLPDNVYSRMR